MSRRLTRRQALARATVGGAAILTGCGGGRTAGSGSTRQRVFADPSGDGVLQLGAGQPLIDRTELAPRAAASGQLATLVHLTDTHVLDAQSPARVPFLDRLGTPFTSTFRPQETLTAQVLAGAVRAINSFAPQAVIQGGDLIDNAQLNELEQAFAALGGRMVTPASGGGPYEGVQGASDPDPFYYRPDVDAPRHPGLLQEAVRPFATPRLRAPWYPVLGDHDLLVAGVLAPSPTTQAIARGDRAVWELPGGLGALNGIGVGAGWFPDGLSDPAVINRFLEITLSAPSVRVSPDARRRQMSPAEVLRRLRAASGHGGAGPLLDHAFDVGQRLRVIVLDLVRREGGSGGIVHAGQPSWLASQLARAGERWVIVVSHQPLDTSQGGPALLAMLDRAPRVVAAIWGHTHRNRITARPSRGGGYWLVSTASLIDYPQQARALRLLSTTGGGVALQTWMLDHDTDNDLGAVSRELAYLDAQGGRPQHFAGSRDNRNVTLYKGPPAA